MQPATEPAAYVLPFLSHIFNAESEINNIINRNNNPYETAAKIVKYLSSVTNLSPQDIHQFKEYAFKEIRQKYCHLIEELIDIQINIFKLKFY